jgi:glycerol-3-phosphate acyltransferase PlsY
MSDFNYQCYTFCSKKAIARTLLLTIVLDWNILLGLFEVLQYYCREKYMTLNFAWLSLAAFLLGACPFSLWLGRLFLDKDIRRYGDGNPGAANVFRAGSTMLGALAVILDIGKGIPLVVLAHTVFHLTPMAVVGVGLSAMLGHAFSPFLGFKGGKALAVTAGVVIGFLNATLFWSFFLSALLYFIILEDRPWIVLLTPVTCLVFLLISAEPGWYSIFMLCVLALFALKHTREVNALPRLKPRLASMFQFRRPT